MNRRLPLAPVRDVDASRAGATWVHHALRALLVLGFVVVAALGFVVAWQPRFFWTMLLPLLPVSIVLMGFANWRRICPLAGFGEIGRWLNRRGQRRVPRWLESAFFPVTFGVLLAMLALRLLATNGDGRWLGGLLAALAIAALVVNLVWTGKSWCNFFCPVGVVERIYTEPSSFAATTSSQCERCTACKKNCPDIDLENGYWREVERNGRRVVYFAFPGLVLGFYGYYWLRHGDWAAYFDGRWTRHPVDAALWSGPGFFFAPSVPAFVAAPLTLLVLSLASLAAFSLLETLAAHFTADPARRRHQLLSLAAFAAFNCFYLFAGAPSLLTLPGAARLVAFAIPVLATVVLVRRWRRTRERYLQEKGLEKILASWPFEHAPPEDPGEVFAYMRAHEQARDANLACYRDAIRGILADGLVTPDELRLLEQLREKLGVSERQHQRVLDELGDEESVLFEPGRVMSLEKRVQLEGYERALETALLRKPSERELEALRKEHGIDEQAHELAVAHLRGEAGAFVARAERNLERLASLQRDEALARALAPDAGAFLAYALQKAREQVLGRLLEGLEILAEASGLSYLRTRLASEDGDDARAALAELRDACGGASKRIVDKLRPLLGPVPESPEIDRDARRAALEALAGSGDPFQRAGAIHAAGGLADAGLAEVVREALSDDFPLVREMAVRACVRVDGAFDRERLRRLLGDQDRRVQVAAAEALKARRDPSPEASTASADPAFSSIGAVATMLLLRRVPLFVDLEPVDLLELCAMTSEETFGPEDVVCKAGEDSNDLFLVVSGEVTLLAPGAEPNAEIATLASGAVVGELAVVLGSPRTATVRPRGGSVTLLRVDGRAFRSRLLYREHVAPTLIGTLAQRLRDIQRLAG